MRENAARAIAAFTEHVAKLATSKNLEPHQEPSEEDKAERDRLMQEVLDAFGLSKRALQTQLNIDKSTWDRWRAIKSVPQPSHLVALGRFARQKDSVDDEDGDREPRPLDMLLEGPKTWGRVRLVYSYYPWRNAVFNFRTPYKNLSVATDMARLALKRCSIVYCMEQAEDWSREFSKTFVNILGRTYAARALSQICIVKAELLGMPQFGVFNYEAESIDMRVGYVWKGADSVEPPKETDTDVYDGEPGNGDLFRELHERYDGLIQRAFEKITKNTPDDFWISTLRTEELLEIPIIGAESDSERPGGKSGRRNV